MNPKLPIILSRKFCGKKGLPRTLRENTLTDPDLIAAMQAEAASTLRNTSGTVVAPRSRRSTVASAVEGQRPKRKRRPRSARRRKPQHRRNDTEAMRRNQQAANLRRKRQMQREATRPKAIQQGTPLSALRQAYSDASTPPFRQGERGGTVRSSMAPVATFS